MKKIISSFIALTMAIMMSFSSVYAFDTNSINSAYEKMYAFYQTKDELRSYDEIIAVESLGLEAEKYQLPDISSVDFANETIGNLTKGIISLILIGENPADYHDQNLIQMLEDCVQSDGSVVKNNYKAESNVMVWTLYALESYNSEKVKLVADALLKTKNANGSFGYGAGTESADVTGWCLEALTIAGFSDQLLQTKEYLKIHERDQDGTWGYSYDGKIYPNATSQACVLIGLLTSDKENLLNRYYDVNDKNPLDVLASMQNNDGTFWDDANATYETFDTVRAIGTYQNGSVIYRAQQSYKNIIENKTEENEQPKQPENENKNIENTENKENEVSKSVKTGDTTHVSMFISLIIISGALYIYIRKNEKNNQTI